MHMVGITRAKEIAMRARRIAAPEAAAWGIVSASVPDGELDAAVARLAAELTSFSPLAQRSLKRALDSRNFFDFNPNDPTDIGHGGPPKFQRNQFGASGGGAIQKDKTFLFANYEGLRQNLDQSSLTFVPANDASAVTERNQPAARAEGVRFLRMEAGAAVYAVGSGTYAFRSTLGGAGG